MSDYQPNHSEFSSLSAAVCFCFHPGGASVGLNSPCGLVAPTLPTCIPTSEGIFTIPTLQAAGTNTGIRAGAFRRSTYFTGPRSTCISRESELVERVHLQTGMPLSQSGSLNHGRGGCIEHIFNLPVIGREVLSMICCSFVRGSTWRAAVHTSRSCCSMGVCRVSVPFQIWGLNLRGTLSFCYLYHGA